MSLKNRRIPVETLKEAVYLDYAAAITVSRSYASVADISADSMSVVGHDKGKGKAKDKGKGKGKGWKGKGKK